MHTILLKSQYDNTPTPTCFRLNWPFITEHTIVKSWNTEREIR